jgi:hypothetical protein
MTCLRVQEDALLLPLLMSSDAGLHDAALSACLRWIALNTAAETGGPGDVLPFLRLQLAGAAEGYENRLANALKRVLSSEDQNVQVWIRITRPLSNDSVSGLRAAIL